MSSAEYLTSCVGREPFVTATCEMFWVLLLYFNTNHLACVQPGRCQLRLVRISHGWNLQSTDYNKQEPDTHSRVYTHLSCVEGRLVVSSHELLLRVRNQSRSRQIKDVSPLCSLITCNHYINELSNRSETYLDPSLSTGRLTVLCLSPGLVTGLLNGQLQSAQHPQVECVQETPKKLIS